MEQKSIYIIAPPEASELLYHIFVRAGYTVLGISHEGRPAIEDVRLYCPDVVIVSSHLGDMSGLSVAAALEGFGILILSSPQDKESIAAANKQVVVVDYCADKRMLLQTVEVMCRMQDRIQTLQNRVKDLTRKLEETKLITKAKVQLMEKMQITEGQAHRMIQKTSMDKGINMAELSRVLIRRFEKIQ